MIYRPKNKKREQQAAAMGRQVNEQAVSEEVLKTPSTTAASKLVKTDLVKTKATSFRFPIEFIDELDTYQRSNEKNPTRKSKTKIVMQAVSEYMRRH